MNRPGIGGILSILAGLIGGLGILNYWIGFGPEHSGFGKGDIPPFVPSIIFSLPIPALIIAAVSIIGGVFILKRRNYRWALIGGVTAAASFIPLGVPALVLIVMSEKEFN
ncbi:hypothetical protein ABFB09_02080 [Dehalogenimonas sp. THU2]|uniref:hypothetical protein n=1 Tax=Dehalogenimonas sp. THU2 TaxID=3151121 RepID=UPI0032186E44